MNCQRVERENLAERYVAGTLGPELKDHFERHLFECGECAEQVETWLALKQPLHEMAPAIRREMQPRRSWIGGAIAVAAGIAVLAAVSSMPRHDEFAPAQVTQDRATDLTELTELAKLDPPAYAPPILRGVETTAEARFREAMEFYLRRDYPAAIRGLRASLELDPHAGAARFFLGASELLSGRTADGVRDLETVARGDSPFAEEAGFDLAKGYLALGRRQEAEAALREVESKGGEFAARARSLIDDIGRVK